MFTSGINKSGKAGSENEYLSVYRREVAGGTPSGGIQAADDPKTHLLDWCWFAHDDVQGLDRINDTRGLTEDESRRLNAAWHAYRVLKRLYTVFYKE